MHQNPHSSANANPSLPSSSQDPAIEPQPRRPRGFAATAAAAAVSSPTSTAGKGKREREKEKERTKLRERHRRAITSRMLAGLRQYGNFPLPARADMNDVLAALAREAGWTVEPDGNTFRQSPPPQQMGRQPARNRGTTRLQLEKEEEGRAFLSFHVKSGWKLSAKQQDGSHLVLRGNKVARVLTASNIAALFKGTRMHLKKKKV